MNLDCTALGMLISLHTGLRIGEVCALKWSDVDIERKILTVRQTVARVKANSNDNCKSKLILDAPKTKNSLREIPINSFLLPLLVKRNLKVYLTLSYQSKKHLSVHGHLNIDITKLWNDLTLNK